LFNYYFRVVLNIITYYLLSNINQGDVFLGKKIGDLKSYFLVKLIKELSELKFMVSLSFDILIDNLSIPTNMRSVAELKRKSKGDQ
jgi:hypothetical protein